MNDAFQDVRADMERIGYIYRKIRQLYENDIAVTYIDPRNHFAIIGYLLRHWKNGFLRFPDLLRSWCFGIRRGAFFYNGYWINPDQTLNEEDIMERIAKIHLKGDQ